MVILWTACIVRVIKYENLCLNDDRIFSFLELMNVVFFRNFLYCYNYIVNIIFSYEWNYILSWMNHSIDNDTLCWFNCHVIYKNDCQIAGCLTCTIDIVYARYIKHELYIHIVTEVLLPSICVMHITLKDKL